MAILEDLMMKGHAARRPAKARTFTAMMERLMARLDLGRQRRALQELDDRLLRDIDVSRSAAETEAARGLWDAPQHWKTRSDPARMSFGDQLRVAAMLGAR